MTAQVEISTLSDGRGVLFIDGMDMSRWVSGFTVEAEAGEGIEITLRLRKGMTMDLASDDPAVTLVRQMLVEQKDCICTEILPELGSHLGGLDVDPACPQHGRITP